MNPKQIQRRVVLRRPWNEYLHTKLPTCMFASFAPSPRCYALADL